VVTWGWNVIGQVPPGLSGVTGIAAGGFHSLALKSDGTVVAWGDDGLGQTDVPAGLTGVTAIAAGGNFSLGLVSVAGPLEELTSLGNAVIGVGPGHSLANKVKNAYAALLENDVTGTCSILTAFTNEVGAQSGNKIVPSVAASLIADAAEIRSVLDC
jgi:hypothetical protein